MGLAGGPSIHPHLPQVFALLRPAGESEEPGATGRHLLEAEKPGRRASLRQVPPERGLVGGLGEDPALSPSPKGSRAAPLLPPNCPSGRRMPPRPGLRARAGPRGCGPCGGRGCPPCRKQPQPSTMALCPACPAPGGSAQPGQLFHQPLCPQVWRWLLSPPPPPRRPPPPPAPPSLFACCTPSCCHGNSHAHQIARQNLCLALVSPAIRHPVQLPGRVTWAWRAVGWPMLTVQDLGAHHGSAAPPCPHTLEGRQCCPQTCAGRGPGPLQCLLLVTALGLAVRSDCT